MENGCLKIIPKSHLLGILPHENYGFGASDNGVDKIIFKNLLDIGYQYEPIIMNPGDVVFFHGNTIHASEDNNSDKSRISMIVTLNTKK